MAEKGPLKDIYLPEVLIEMRRVGKSLRVTAIDPITQIEVVMVAPASATRAEIKRNARSKLAYVIAKKHTGGKGGEGWEYGDD
ncbi:MAG: hypothetical protein O3A85_03715 [Proteobacteria bacterium]|nr:hypothetical protein [Pseudomonadota bacterium]